jgi:hypothetical protein
MKPALENNHPPVGTVGHKINVEFLAARQLEFQIKQVVKNSAPVSKQAAVPPLLLFQFGAQLDGFIAENPEFATPLGKKTPSANFMLYLEKFEAVMKTNGKGK